MQVYHVSLDTEGDMYKLFEPRIPWAMSEEEDAYTPRICVSTNIVGAVSGVGYDAAFEVGTSIMVYSADVQERFLERPDELLAYHGVMDAMYTQEHWVTWPLMMHGSIYQIESFERDNYLLPEPRVERKVREYLSARYDTYRESLTLHELLNHFIRRVGIDEEDFAEMFDIQGIRVFTRLALKAADGSTVILRSG